MGTSECDSDVLNTTSIDINVESTIRIPGISVDSTLVSTQNTTKYKVSYSQNKSNLPFLYFSTYSDYQPNL